MELLSLTVDQIGLSARTSNCLRRNDYHTVEDMLKLDEATMGEMRNMGKTSISEVLAKIEEYKHLIESKHGPAGVPLILERENVEKTRVLRAGKIRDYILAVYQDDPFCGFDLPAVVDKHFDEPSDEHDFSIVLREMLGDNTLEYKEGVYFRRYPGLMESMHACEKVSDREIVIFTDRLEGATLQSIAELYDITRERVRQIVNNCLEKTRKWNLEQHGTTLFWEDSFLYLYENYALEKDLATQYIFKSPHVWTYLKMSASQKGKRSLELALEDRAVHSRELRACIADYLNHTR